MEFLFARFQVSKCPATGKSKYKSQERADRAKMYIWSHDPSADIGDLHSYICEHCGCWHVGHKSYYEKKLKDENSRSKENQNNQ